MAIFRWPRRRLGTSHLYRPEPEAAATSRQPPSPCGPIVVGRIGHRRIVLGEPWRPGPVAARVGYGLDADPAAFNEECMRTFRSECLGVDRRARRAAALGAREPQYQDGCGRAVVAQRDRRVGDRQQHALHARRAAVRVAAEGRGLRCLGLRPAVAVMLEPTRQLEARSRGPRARTGRRFRAHRDQRRRRARPARRDGVPSAPASGPARWARCPAAASACSTARTTVRRQPSARTRRSEWPARGRRRPAGRATRLAHHTIASMPHPITHSGAASSPNGIATSVASAAGMTIDVADRDGEEVGEDGELLRVVEMVDAERRHGEARDQRRGDDAAEEQQRVAQRPAHASPPRAPLAPAQPLVGRDQRHHRGKRHLEARIEQALRPHHAGSPAPPAPHCAAPRAGRSSITARNMMEIMM